jgi:uncharacterized membrane protein YgcG
MVMTTNLTDVLDIATKRMISGEPIPTVLAEYPAHARALYPLLNTAVMLETIRPVEMPRSEVLQADRDAFLARVANLQQQPVSPEPLKRLKEWIVHYLPWNLLNSTHQRKEQRRMNALLIKAVMVFSVIFGSTGGTAVYAAHSLPGSPVYPLKLSMEQARLALTSDPASQANVHLTLAQVRTQEMEQLAQQGIVPDEATLNRLQLHLNQALHLAAQLPDGEMQQLLTQTQQMLQTQEQQLTQTQAQVDEPVQLALRQANRLLNQVRQEVEAGRQDPQTFRWRYTQEGNPEAPCDTDDCAPAQNQNQHQNRSQPEEVPGDCNTDDCEPQQNQNQNQNQNRSQPEETPGDCDTDDCEPAQNQNQNQYQHQNQNNTQSEEAPGACDTDDCEPAQNQNQNQHQNQNQNGLQSEEPASPCQADECEPIGDEHRYGPQPDQPGPGQPGGNPDGCDGGDCEPEGDQYQHGQQPEQPTEKEPNAGTVTPPATPSPSPPTNDGGNQEGSNSSNDDNGGNGGDHGDNQSGDNGGGDQGGGDSGGGDHGGGGSSDGGGGGGGGKK